MRQGRRRYYEALRSFVEALGGTMEHVRNGAPGGAWIAALGDRSARFESNQNGFPEIDVLYVPRVDVLTHYTDDTIELRPRALERFAEMLRERGVDVPVQAPIAPRPKTTRIGTAYRRADEQAAQPDRDPQEVDPAVVERGVRGHAVTQNALADYLAARGIEPRSPKPDEHSFDLAWQAGERVCVAEVKSTTDANEEKQLRLGLGQVLRYAALMSTVLGRDVIPVLVPERRPTDPSWEQLCASLGVVLAWPGVFEERFGGQ